MSKTKVNRGFGLTREGVYVFFCVGVRVCVCVAESSLEIVNFWGRRGFARFRR